MVNDEQFILNQVFDQDQFEEFTRLLAQGEIVYAKTSTGDWVKIQDIRTDGYVRAHSENYPYFGDPEPNSWFLPKDIEAQ